MEADLHCAELENPLTGVAKDKAASILYELRKAGFTADKDYQDRKLKAQFKAADRLNVKYVALLGEDELAKSVINVKDMATGTQEEVQLANFIEYLLERS